MGTGHLQLEVCVIGDDHELNGAWSHQDGVVGSREIHHLELQPLGTKVGGFAECDMQSDSFERVGLAAGHDVMEWSELRCSVERAIAKPSKVLMYMMLRPLPPSMSSLERHFEPIISSTTRGRSRDAGSCLGDHNCRR